MIRVCIVCEGHTEVEFVNLCLSPHLIRHNINAYPSILQSPSGRRRGGRVTVERLAKHISHEYHAANRITTLVDYYGFRDRNDRSRQQLECDILQKVEQCTAGFDQRFMLPYVQMHEFEGLLFSDISQFQWVLDGWDEEARSNLQFIRDQFENPECINNSPQTAPSKRLELVFSNGSYSKVEHGPIIAEAIGLDNIRCECPQFNEWVTRLEAWGQKNY